MNFQLSSSLLSQLQQAIKNAPPSQCCTDYRNKLTTEEVNQLRAFLYGNQSLDRDFSYRFWDAFNEVEREHILQILIGYRSQIEAEGGKEHEDISDEDLLWLIEEYDLVSSCPRMSALLSIEH